MQKLMIQPARYSLAYESFGSPDSVLRLVETQLDNLPAGHLRVSMSLAPINPSDLIPVTGAYAHRTRLPAVAGCEGVGHVIEAPPELADFIGKRVLPLRGEGTWQTIVDCASDTVVPVPDAACDQIAARAYINPLAAVLLVERWPVRDKVVVLCGAGSNCAEHLARLAYKRGAANVIGIYRSESRAQRLKFLGVEAVPMWDARRIQQVAMMADVTFDALGGPLASAILATMRAGANFVGYGLLTGRPVTTSVSARASVARFHLRDALHAMTAREFRRYFDGIWPLLLESTLPEARVWPAREWRRAIHAATSHGGSKQMLDLASLGSGSK